MIEISVGLSLLCSIPSKLKWVVWFPFILVNVCKAGGVRRWDLVASIFSKGESRQDPLTQSVFWIVTRAKRLVQSRSVQHNADRSYLPLHLSRSPRGPPSLPWLASYLLSSYLQLLSKRPLWIAKWQRKEENSSEKLARGGTEFWVWFDHLCSALSRFSFIQVMLAN